MLEGLNTGFKLSPKLPGILALGAATTLLAFGLLPNRQSPTYIGTHEIYRQDVALVGKNDAKLVARCDGFALFVGDVRNNAFTYGTLCARDTDGDHHVDTFHTLEHAVDLADTQRYLAMLPTTSGTACINFQAEALDQLAEVLYSP